MMVVKPLKRRYSTVWSILDCGVNDWLRNARGARRAWSTCDAALEALRGERMAKLMEVKWSKESASQVSADMGPDRGRWIMVRVTPRGVFLRPKGLPDVQKVFVRWDDIYAFGVRMEAKDKLRRG